MSNNIQVECPECNFIFVTGEELHPVACPGCGMMVKPIAIPIHRPEELLAGSIVREKKHGEYLQIWGYGIRQNQFIVAQVDGKSMDEPQYMMPLFLMDKHFLELDSEGNLRLYEFAKKVDG